jgi:hypothetical protein
LEADPDLGNLKVGAPHINARRPGEIRPLLGDRKTKPPKGR